MSFSFTFYCSSIKTSDVEQLPHQMHYLHSTVVLLKRSLPLPHYPQHPYLHSTVVLLKRSNSKPFPRCCLYLHSTVVLLKLIKEGQKMISYKEFTFYCSSIKTVFPLVFKPTMILFTFYCSSIKTYFQSIKYT